ncbi:MAG: response regulator [Anaerolineae bacterium]|nr:response regulator [Anaerolineae bacterium]
MNTRTLPQPFRALVVEDDPSWQQILVEILTDEGLDVDLADSLPTADACIGRRTHRLAVIDLSLGREDHRNQDGLQVLEAVRKHDPACTALLLTGYATVELAVQVLTVHGALTCLRKEAFRRSEFRRIVRETVSDAQAGTLGAHRASPEGAPSSPPSLAASESPLPAGDGMQLALLVEDDAGWRNVLAELLAESNLQVHTSRSYGEALGMLRHYTYALAVVDLTLASSVAPFDNTDGLRLLESTDRAGIPAIVVSGSAWPADVDEAFKRRAIIGYLEKRDFDRQAFLWLVDRALAAAPTAGLLAALTNRELEVLELLGQGLSNKEMAEALVISENTIKRHLKAIFAKLEVNNRAAAVARLLGQQSLSGGQ